MHVVVGFSLVVPDCEARRPSAKLANRCNLDVVKVFILGTLTGH